MLDGVQLEGAIVRGVVLGGVGERPCKVSAATPVATAGERFDLAGCRAYRRAERLDSFDTGSIDQAVVALACGDAYAARGLTAQVFSNTPGRESLLWAVESAAAPCKGIALLPADALAALHQRGVAFRPSPRPATDGTHTTS